MAYSTDTEVRKRVPAVYNDATGTEQIAAGIAAADAEIDGRLRGRYTVPFSPVPVLIQSISVDLAAAWALSAAYSGVGPNEQVRFAEYLEKRARELLELLAQGELLLSGTTGTLPLDAVPFGFVGMGDRPKMLDFDPYGRKPFKQWPGR